MEKQIKLNRNSQLHLTSILFFQISLSVLGLVQLAIAQILKFESK